MQDRSGYTVSGDVPRDAEQLPLTLVLTCTTCDQTYEPTAEALAAGRLGCPYPDCGGWTFSTALTVPTTRTASQGGAA